MWLCRSWQTTLPLTARCRRIPAPGRSTLRMLHPVIPRACRLDSTMPHLSREASRFGQICKVTGVNEEDQISTCLKVAAEDPSETYCKSEFLLFGKSLVLVARLSDITRTAWILGVRDALGDVLWTTLWVRSLWIRILLADPRSF